MRLLDFIARVVFGIASIFLILLAVALVCYAGWGVVQAIGQSAGNLGSILLEAVGYTIIAIAVFDVGKYLLEEEAIRARELRHAGEARRSLTKFVSTIAIAVFLEALVAVFEAAKEDMSMMLYPTLLMFVGVTLIVGLGIFQRLSIAVEMETGGPRKEPKNDAEAKQEKEEELEAPDLAS
jgi:large-conductance mechanosensitive channel